MTEAQLETDPLEAVENFDLHSFVTFRIPRLHAALDRQAIHLLKEISGLRQNEWKILSTVGTGLAATSIDVVRATDMDPAIVSRTLRSMQLEGLIVTQRSNEDRRTVQLELSRLGREKFEKTFPYMQARQRRLMTSLTKDERRTLLRVFDKLEKASESREVLK